MTSEVLRVSRRSVTSSRRSRASSAGRPTDDLRRRYLVLDMQGVLHLHQNVRAKDGGRPPLASLAVDGADVTRVTEICLELKLSDRTLCITGEQGDVDGWADALMAAAAAEAEDELPPVNVDVAVLARREANSYRVSGMDTVEHLDLKVNRRNRTASVETYEAANAARSDDEKALLGLLWEAASRGDDDDELDELFEGLPEGERDGADVLGRTALFLAAVHGHGGTCTKLVSAGLSMEKRSNAGATPLMAACEKGHLDAVVALLESGASVVAPVTSSDNHNDDATTSVAKYADGPAACMRLACASGSVGVVQALLAARRGDIDLEHTSQGGGTALAIATTKSHEGIARTLVGAGAICDVHSAAALGIANVLRDAPAESLALTDALGRTPLLIGCSLGHDDLVKLMIERGAKLDVLDGFKTSPLLAACATGHLAVVTRLLAPGGEQAKAMLTHENADGETALLLACRHGHLPVVETVLAAMQEHLNEWETLSLKNRSDTRGASPILVAVAGGKAALVDALLGSGGVQLDQIDRFGCSALMVAAAAGSSLVSPLLAANADVNRRDNARETPLMAATMHGHEQSVAQLLAATGVDVDAANADGETALMLAVGEHNQPILTALLEAGARVDAVDVQGRSALMRVVGGLHEERARRRSLADRTPRAVAPMSPLSPVTPITDGPGGKSPGGKLPNSPAAAPPSGSPALPTSPSTPGSVVADSPGTQDWLASSIAMVNVLLENGASVGLRDESGADALKMAASAPSVFRLLNAAKRAHPERHVAVDFLQKPNKAAKDTKETKASAKAAAKASAKEATKEAKVGGKAAAKEGETTKGSGLHVSRTPTKQEAAAAVTVAPKSSKGVKPGEVDVQIQGEGEKPEVPKGGGCCVLQ